MKRELLHTYLFTPWCRVLLEKQIGLHLVKKFPAFHGTRSFNNAITSARHLSLFWASPIESIYPHPTSWRSIVILSTHLHLGLPSGLLPSGFPTNALYTQSPQPYAPHAQPVSIISILSPAQYWVKTTDHLAPRCAISSIPRYLSLIGRNILLKTMFSTTLSFLYSLKVNNEVKYPYKTTGKIIILYILIFKFFDSILEDENSAPNYRKFVLTSICS